MVEEAELAGEFAAEPEYSSEATRLHFCLKIEYIQNNLPKTVLLLPRIEHSLDI